MRLAQYSQSFFNLIKVSGLGLKNELIPHHSPQLPRFSPALSESQPVCKTVSGSPCMSGRVSADWHSLEPRNAVSQRSVELTAGTGRAWPTSCLGDEGFDWHCRLQRHAWVSPCHLTRSPHPTERMEHENKNEPEAWILHNHYIFTKTLENIQWGPEIWDPFWMIYIVYYIV